MAFRFVSFAAFIATAYAASPVYSVGQYAAPAVQYGAPAGHYAAAPAYKTVVAEAEGPAEYQFEYSVHDDHTGDIKSQKEIRHGDQVQGQYSLIDADGYRRVVDYTSDAHSGFNAIVHREPIKGYVAPVQKVAYAAAPVAHYAAPAQYAQYAAPAHYAAPAQYAAPAHYAAPAQYAKVSAPISYSQGGAAVSYNAPGSNYHY